LRLSASDSLTFARPARRTELVIQLRVFGTILGTQTFRSR
jgi:hypothetical protein